MDETLPSFGCAWPYAIVDGVRKHIREVPRYTHGICPLCGAELEAKKGTDRVHHWAHAKGQACDAWYQRKGAWHLGWQNLFPEEWQENIVTKRIDDKLVKHVADVRTPEGLVVEAQWSPMSKEEMYLRESFYGDMVWVVGMLRKSVDASLSFKLKQHAPFLIEGRTVLCFQGVSKSQWLESKCPVFMDFVGTLDNPDREKRLILLLPNDRGNRLRICFAIKQLEFSDAVKNGTLKYLIKDLVQLQSKALEKISQQFEAEEREEQKRKQLRQKEIEAELLARYKEIERRDQRRIQRAEADILYLSKIVGSDKASAFVRMGRRSCDAVLSLGWIEANLACYGMLREIRLESVSKAKLLSEMGSLYIHATSSYSMDQYKQDIEKYRDVIGMKINYYSYDALAKKGNHVAGIVDYLKVETQHETMLYFRKGH